MPELNVTSLQDTVRRDCREKREVAGRLFRNIPRLVRVQTSGDVNDCGRQSELRVPLQREAEPLADLADLLCYPVTVSVADTV